MKGNSMKNYAEIGKRVKEEARKKKYTTQQLADLLNYSDRTQISKMYSGERKFTENQIEMLAETFRVKKEYLLLETDFRTEEEERNAKNKASFERFQKYSKIDKSVD